MHIRKKWILSLCCVFLACVIGASAISCAFNGRVDNSANLDVPAGKLENVTGQYDVSNLTTANFNDTVTKIDTTETEISVIIDLGGNGLYDIYDGKGSFSDFVYSPRGVKYFDKLTKQQNTFISALQKSGIEYTYRGAYTSVSNAVAIRINSADFYKLGKIDGVKHVYRNEVYAIPEAVTVVENLTPVYTTGVYDSSSVEDYKGDGLLVAVLDTGLDYTHEAFQTMPTGENTDWNYNAIAQKFNPSSKQDMLYSQSLGNTVDDVYVNAKVPYAFDYADDDADVYPSYSNHGTHVAGIIAGKDDTKVVGPNNETFVGVAPNAQLAIMKVFTDNLDSKMLGGADSVDILHAIDDCAKLGVNVINMSLGSAGGFSDYASDEYVTGIYQRIQEAGISLIVAAGNEYSSGFGGGNGTNLASNPDSGTIGSPSTYEAALSVASIEGQKAPYVIGNKDKNDIVAFITNASDAYGNEMDFINLLYKALNETDTSKPITLPYVVIGGVGGNVNYSVSIRRQFAKEPTIALVKRGDINFADKVQYAKDNGAAACIIYNNLSGTIRMSLGELQNPIPACSIGLEAGTALVNNAQSGMGTITISKDYVAGPFMSEFSSWGPTPSLRLKPEITAYGGKILSAIPGGYDQQSGTSMASPNMAGMVALMRQFVGANFKNASGEALTGAELNARVYQMLMSTTTMVNNDEGNPYSPRKQGAGLGNLHAAINTKAYITVNEKDGSVSPKTKIELYDDPKRTGEYEMEFTVHNISNGAVSYQPHVYTMTETLAVDQRTVSEKAHMLNDTEVKVYVGSTEVGDRLTIAANSSVTVKVTLKLGSAGRKYIEDSFKNGMYVEGFVRFENGTDASDAEINDIGIPYLAFYGDWADAPMFDYTMYEISENENDTSVEPEDKIHPSASSTTPLGSYEDNYIIPLGSYVYEMEETDVAITASDERAAISIFNEDYGPTTAVNKLYGIYAGLLRGAKEMEISIVDTVTGENVFYNVVYNQRKSYAGGGSNVGSPVMLDINPYEWDWNNNTQYELTLKGKLDWTDDDGKLVVPDKNTFTFKFTVDYEAPSITDYRVRFEPYTENRETKYRIYMDVDVFDNQYTMSLLPCFMQKEADGSNTLVSLTRYPLPVYSQKNDVTTVSFEITDYYEDYFKTGNFFLYPIDYALNHSLYRVTANEAIDYPEEVIFDTSDGLLQKSIREPIDGYTVQVYRLTLSPNQVYKLNQLSVLPEGTVNHKLEWKVSDDRVKAYENEIFAGPEQVDNVTLQLTANNRVLAKIMVYVRGDALAEPRLKSIAFKPILNGDNYVEAVGMSVPLNNNTQTQLRLEIDPWYYDESKLQINWSSNNELIATVDQNGLVSTKTTGSAWITAEVEGNSIVRTSVQVVVSSDYEVRNYRLYNYYGGEVAEIPEQLNIMYLDEECFQDNTTIRKVVLPETLTEIPEGAFTGCSNLEEVVIPASCRVILGEAFSGCSKLKKITLSKFVNDVDQAIIDRGDATFEELARIGSLTISSRAFYGCTSLETIENSQRITTLGNSTFYGCTGLKEIDISGLRIVGDSAFRGCTNLAKITMSEQTRLGTNMFYGCSKLGSLDVVNVLTDSIPYGAFSNCTALTDVTLTNVKSIGERAFFGCTALQQITLPNGNCTLGMDVFSGCSKLATVNFGVDTYISNDMYTTFAECEALETINVANGNVHYSSYNGALYTPDYTRIVLVPVRAAIDDIDAFIHEDTLHIGASAFAGNSSLKAVNDLSRFQTVGVYAFAASGLKSIAIPESWTSIPEGLFYACASLATVTFQGNSSVKVIGESAFGDCDVLANISLPDSITEIGEAAFMNCLALGGIPNLANVQKFGGYSFTGTVVTQIIAPNATTLEDYAFIAMRKLTDVELGAIEKMGESVFCDIEVTAQGQGSIVGSTSIRSVKFGEGTKVIGAYALATNSVRDNLTNVEIPSSVETIGEFAFMNRGKITTLDLSGVKTIGDQAFLNCRGLTAVDLSSVTKLGIASFANTTSLKEANLLNAVDIGAGAFENSGIESLTISNAKNIDAFAFSGTKLKSVTIPASLNQYSYFEDDYYKINEAGDSEQVKGKKSLSIMGGAFMNISTLTAFNVDSANQTFFADEDGVLYARAADGLVLVQYPAGRTAKEYKVLDGTVRIGDYAFYDDSSLEKITFPVSLKSIGTFAFYNGNTDGTFSRHYVFEAVEAPTLETSLVSFISEYVENNEASLVFGSDPSGRYPLGATLAIFSNVYYANFGNFAALKMEEDHVWSQAQWLKDQGSTLNFTYKAPVYNYVITRPENGIGYATPVWNAYFAEEHINLSPYAAERITAEAIKAIQDILSSEQIKTEIDGISGNEAKLARLNEISQNSLRVARDAYNLIVQDQQKALVTDYGKLLASEQTVRDLKGQLGQPVELQELRREGYYKSRYEEGETFDPQSMKIIAIYADGSLLELTPQTYTLSNTGALTTADTSVTISYGGKSLQLAIVVMGDPDNPNKPDDPKAPSDTNVGLIVGLSVGGAVVAAGVAVLVVLLLRKKKNARVTADAAEVGETDQSDKTE